MKLMNTFFQYKNAHKYISQRIILHYLLHNLQLKDRLHIRCSDLQMLRPLCPCSIIQNPSNMIKRDTSTEKNHQMFYVNNVQ